MLLVDSINTFYGKAQVLFDLSFEVNRGEVVVMLGRNGAGKSTTFKSVMGMVPPASGNIAFKETTIHDLPPHKTCALGLGYVPEDRRIFTRLTIKENLEVGKQPARTGYRSWTTARLMALFPNLGEKPHQLAGHLSGVGKLRHPARIDEAGQLDGRDPGVREGVDQAQLVGGRD